jgi:hypothetical protein
MGWLKFYGSYLWLYLKGRFKGLGHEEAYRTHPYEEEAYSTAGSLIPTSEELTELGEDARAR